MNNRIDDCAVEEPALSPESSVLGTGLLPVPISTFQRAQEGKTKHQSQAIAKQAGNRQSLDHGADVRLDKQRTTDDQRADHRPANGAMPHLLPLLEDMRFCARHQLHPHPALFDILENALQPLRQSARQMDRLDGSCASRF